MFEEMRHLAASDKTISPEEILRMATINGARALGLSGQTGELSENCAADLIAIPDGKTTADIYENVLAHSGNVIAGMIDGRWTIPPK